MRGCGCVCACACSGERRATAAAGKGAGSPVCTRRGPAGGAPGPHLASAAPAPPCRAPGAERGGSPRPRPRVPVQGRRRQRGLYLRQRPAERRAGPLAPPAAAGGDGPGVPRRFAAAPRTLPPARSARSCLPRRPAALPRPFRAWRDAVPARRGRPAPRRPPRVAA